MDRSHSIACVEMEPPDDVCAAVKTRVTRMPLPKNVLIIWKSGISCRFPPEVLGKGSLSGEGSRILSCDLKQSTGGSIDWSTEGYFPYVR